VEAGLDGDVLAVSGGVSVGPHDHVKPALQQRGVEEVFWRVRLKPGKPLWFGRRGATLVFGLPGNPLSTVACFLLFVGPALRRLQGDAAAAPPYVPARLAIPARPADGRTTLLTARLERGGDGVLEATPTEGQGSHLTGALAASDGFVVVPHGAGELPAGSAVDALLL
jgi:molybdopterin molybdotransferase